MVTLPIKPELIGGIPTPLKNMSSSDWIIIPTGENKCHVPNHQPGYHSVSWMTSHRNS